MNEITFTMKLRVYPDEQTVRAFEEMSKAYMDACNFVSRFVFDNGFCLNSNSLHKKLYREVRAKFGLKSQFACSVFKTVTARYKTVREQLAQRPYKYEDENRKWRYVSRTLEWLWKPVEFHRPQIDLVRGSNYSFSQKGTSLSLSTLGDRIKVSFDKPKYFERYFDRSCHFGTAKLVRLKKNWYLHIPVSKFIDRELNIEAPSHVVGLDRGLRFIVTGYDEQGKTSFISGKEIARKRRAFARVRAQLQSKGTKSAKRALKRLSGRENRWMSDVNHRISKTLVDRYGENTLFVMENLAGVSFAEENQRGKKQNRDLHSWTFFQLEQFLRYKAKAVGSDVIEVSAEYTSQRCPKCGRIRKQNRHHSIHEYICDSCGYRSNDDRVGAMNINTLGTMRVSGDTNPRFGVRKVDD